MRRGLRCGTWIQEQAGRVRLSTDAGTVRARAIVGCDGSAGRIGRYVGVEMAQVDLGLELELELTRSALP